MSLNAFKISLIVNSNFRNLKIISNVKQLFSIDLKLIEK